MSICSLDDIRQIAFDTETSGLSTVQGHRIIEIAGIEIVNRQITGNFLHCYLDPEREVDAGAFTIHGISNEFLKGKPKFYEKFTHLLEFIQGAELIIHNAPFDVGFLDYELTLMGQDKKITDHCKIFDTLAFARKRHPGQKNNLNALCDRYGIDISARDKHNALLDAELLAALFLAMTGGQGSLFSEEENIHRKEGLLTLHSLSKPLPVIPLSAEEEQEHQAFLELITQSSGATVSWED